MFLCSLKNCEANFLPAAVIAGKSMCKSWQWHLSQECESVVINDEPHNWHCQPGQIQCTEYRLSALVLVSKVRYLKQNFHLLKKSGLRSASVCRTSWNGALIIQNQLLSQQWRCHFLKRFQVVNCQWRTIIDTWQKQAYDNKWNKYCEHGTANLVH